MLNKEAITKQFEGLTEDEALALLADEYGIVWTPQETSCKMWYAKVFNYCRADDLQEQLEDFLWFINNIVVPITKSCFNQEDTVFQGCTCQCGRKQTILYYTLMRS